MTNVGDEGYHYVGGYVVIPFDPSLDARVSKVTAFQNKDLKNSPVPTLSLFDAVFPTINQCIKAAVSQSLSFLYILYPISNRNPAWLLGKAHCHILFQLYSAASAASFETSNPTLDIRVLPIVLQHPVLQPSGVPQPVAFPLFSVLQVNALRYLLRVDDSADSRFIERRRPGGPVVCFACPPPVWHAALRNNTSNSNEESTLSPHPPNTCHDTEDDTTLSKGQSASTSSMLDNIGPMEEGLELRTDEDASDLPESVRQAEYVSTIFLKELLTVTGDIICKVVEFEPLSASIVHPTRDVTFEHSGVCAATLKLYDVSLIGGTFDHLHPGHKYLLSLMALMSTKRVCVGISADDAQLVVKKLERQLLQPLVVRINRLAEFMETLFCILGRLTRLFLPKNMSQLTPEGTPLEGHSIPANFQSLLFSSRIAHRDDIINPIIDSSNCISSNASAPGSLDSPSSPERLTSELEIVVIRDRLGPAASRQDFQCLIITAETRKGGLNVNQARQKNGLPELMLIELPIVASREVLVPDSSIKDARLKDPTGGAPRSPPPPSLRSMNLGLSPIVPSFDHHSVGGLPPLVETMVQDVNASTPRSLKGDSKTSSTHIRESVGEQPTMQRLSHFWKATATTLKFPPLFASAWGTRLLECYSVPWRRANRARLVLAMEKIWDQPVCISSEKPLSLETRGWMAIVLWISLVSASSSSNLVGEDLTTDNVLSRSKCAELFQVFCSDLYITGWMLYAMEGRVSLNEIWRTPESRIEPLFIKGEEEDAFNRDTDEAADIVIPRNPPRISEIIKPWVGDIGREEINEDEATAYITSIIKIQHDRLISTWRSSLEFLDLYGNLTEASLYMVDTFVPKHHRTIEYVGTPITASTLFIRPSICFKCRHINKTLRATAVELLKADRPPLSPRLPEMLLRIDRGSKDFLTAHSRIFDLFGYLFFHDSHRTSLASSSILKIIDELKSPPLESEISKKVAMEEEEEEENNEE